MCEAQLDLQKSGTDHMLATTPAPKFIHGWEVHCQHQLEKLFGILKPWSRAI